MKKVLVVLTNADHFESNNEATGLWLSEATDFVIPMEKAGYEIDYVSPKGGIVPLDPRSLLEQFVSEETDQMHKSEDFSTRALKESLKASDINPDDYAAIYYTGGHGVMFDFVEDETLASIAAKIYENNGYVASVCHGVAGLFNIKTSDDKYLIEGKDITGFTDQEEELSGKADIVPFSNEKEVDKRGAHFVKAAPFTSYVVSDSRVITGQNPMSGKAVAEKLLELL